MSVRDEMARALHRADVEPRRFDPHWNVHEWDEISDEARAYWYRLADALMPLVELAVDRAVSEGWHCGRGSDPDKGEISQHEADAIVARVMEGK